MRRRSASLFARPPCIAPITPPTGKRCRSVSAAAMPPGIRPRTNQIACTGTSSALARRWGTVESNDPESPEPRMYSSKPILTSSCPSSTKPHSWPGWRWYSFSVLQATCKRLTSGPSDGVGMGATRVGQPRRLPTNITRRSQPAIGVALGGLLVKVLWLADAWNAHRPDAKPPDGHAAAR